MSLQTGGRAIGATSTRSRSASWASRSAAPMATMRTGSPFGPTRRTSLTRIRSLILGSVLMGPPRYAWWPPGTKKASAPEAHGSHNTQLRWEHPGGCAHRDRTTRGRTDQAGTRRPGGASADAGGRWTPLAHPGGHQLRQSPGWVTHEATSTRRTAGNAQGQHDGPARWGGTRG